VTLSTQPRASTAHMTGRRVIVLVRHGESVWNMEGRLQGHLDAPLSDRGRAAVIALAPAISRLGVPSERVICSDLGRARETAALLSVEPARYDPAWREIDLGAWSGRLAAEVDAEEGGSTSWRGGRRTPPGGESWSAFGDRIAAAVDSLDSSGSWLVVCHGGAVRAACAHVTGIEPRALASPPNASMTTLELFPRRRLVSFGALPGAAVPPGSAADRAPIQEPVRP
jgi:broad specificity phosphatase PhoE